jgi:nucleoside-diphosphate-sugar epimerase
MHFNLVSSTIQWFNELILSTMSDHVFITGGGGYLGSIMVPMLLQSGYRVTVLDRFFWGTETLSSSLSHPLFRIIRADSRTYDPSCLSDVDAVIDMAAFSNDPSGELDPTKTHAINYLARVRTAELSKKYGVRKYILASSCSVYGIQDGLLNEESAVNPITAYGIANRSAERGVLPLSGPDFCVTVLRYGSLFGMSPRMRFDLVLNAMTLSLFRSHAITVEGGDKWRPILHVTDAASAFATVLAAQSAAVNGHIFNVGATSQNYTILELANIIRLAIDPSTLVHTKPDTNDHRSFRVSFEKINSLLGYSVAQSPQIGATEVYAALASDRVSDTIQTRTIEWYKHLFSKDPTLL